jgi:hypothetical protein
VKHHQRHRTVHHRSVSTFAKRHRSHSSRSPGRVAGGGVWDRLAQCESGGNWSINTGNGFFGGLQFTQSGWRAGGLTNLQPQARVALARRGNSRHRAAFRARRGNSWGRYGA